MDAASFEQSGTPGDSAPISAGEAGEEREPISDGPVVVALDAMGSDNMPEPEIAGAVDAVRQYGVRILLVGRRDVLAPKLAGCPADVRGAIEIVDAPEVISMEEKAIRAVRSKRNSSIHVAIRLVRDGRAHAVVSAGNTGAVMATAKMILGSLPNVQRPALAQVIPTAGDRAAVLLDVGANVDCRPDHLEQFAIMGEIYHRVIFHWNRPRVGLLSIGEEEIKGNELTREAFALLRDLPLNFIGNVEGRDLFNGTVDVIVCDGFVGNVALKISEGLVENIRASLKQAMEASLLSQLGYLLSRPAYAMFKKRMDYSEYGGAPLLGVRGVAIISHGRSNANAIKNAIRVARESWTHHVNEQIEQELARLHPHLSSSLSGSLNDPAGTV